MGIENLKGKIFRLENDLLIMLATRGLISTFDFPMKFVGNSYSGYWFPESLMHSEGTIWGVGLGMDSSFELELGKQGWKVLGFEPDMRCFQQAENEFREINAELLPYGLWDKSGVFESFGQSISLVNIFGSFSGNQDSLHIRDIHEVSDSLQLDKQKVPRVLKMNIEGAEREILLGMVLDPLPFEVVMFQAEFLLHLGFFRVFKKIRATCELRSMIKGLISNDFRLIHNHRNQFTLISSQI